MEKTLVMGSNGFWIKFHLVKIAKFFNFKLMSRSVMYYTSCHLSHHAKFFSNTYRIICKKIYYFRYLFTWYSINYDLIRRF